MEPTPSNDNESQSQKLRKYLSFKREYHSGDEPIIGVNQARRKRNKLVLLSLFMLVFIAAVLVYAFVIAKRKFVVDSVAVKIEAPKNVKSGDEMSLLLEYKNDNQVALTQAVATLKTPEGFVFKSSDQNIQGGGGLYTWQIGQVPAKTTVRARVFGRLIGGLNEEKKFTTLVRYRPVNFNSEFGAQAESAVTISEVPIGLEIKLPDPVREEVSSEIGFTLKNKSDHNFSQLEFHLTIPKNFENFTTSEPALTNPETPNVLVFKKENLAVGQELYFSLKGIFKNSSDAEFRGEVYLMEENNSLMRYVDSKFPVQVARPELQMSYKINEEDNYAAGRGEEVHVEIFFKNQTSHDLLDLILTTEVTGNFAAGSLRAERGNVSGNKLEWNGRQVSDLNGLPPGKEASVEMTFKVPEIFKLESANDKNFKINLNSVVSLYGNGGEGRNDTRNLVKISKVVPVKSFIFLKTSGFFNDDGRIVNGGALPPRVGQETFYTVHWSVKNFFNDTERIKIKAILPEGVDLTGKCITSKGEVKDNCIRRLTGGEMDNFESKEEIIYYNPRTQEVGWFIPKMLANEGVLSPVKEMVFQIKLVPSEKFRNREAALMEKPIITGHDTFANVDVQYEGAALTTQLTDDLSISSEEAKVAVD